MEEEKEAERTGREGHRDRDTDKREREENRERKESQKRNRQDEAPSKPRGMIERGREDTVRAS